jgi:hypothetical protein
MIVRVNIVALLLPFAVHPLRCLGSHLARGMVWWAERSMTADASRQRALPT